MISKIAVSGCQSIDKISSNKKGLFEIKKKKHNLSMQSSSDKNIRALTFRLE